MCGIWGLFSKWSTSPLQSKDMEIIKSMMILTSLRGIDSTGICAVPERGKKEEVIRTVGSFGPILNSERGAAFMANAYRNAIGLFGHGRYATKGGIKVENAHPFVEGDWVLVHNGTIWSGADPTAEMEVDSHVLCAKINELGMKAALESITGAYAIIAYNRTTQELFAARNDQRPLHWWEDTGTTYVMSEYESLQFVLDRADRFHANAYGMKTVQEFKPKKIYRWTPQHGFQIDGDVGEKTIHRPAPKEVAPIGPKPVTYLHAPSGAALKPTSELVSTALHKQGEPIEFYVSEIGRVGNNANSMFLYKCSTIEGEEVRFQSRFQYLELLTETGTAKVSVAVMDGSGTHKYYNVRFREIVWEKEYLNTLTQNEASGKPAPGGAQTPFRVTTSGAVLVDGTATINDESFDGNDESESVGFEPCCECANGVDLADKETYIRLQLTDKIMCLTCCREHLTNSGKGYHNVRSILN